MRRSESASAPRGYTLGHSTRSEREFLRLVKGHDIRYLADVRRFPGSRRHPQFCRENLERILAREAVAYIPLGKELGGFRKEGYEAYMGTDGFQEGMGRLLDAAHRGPTAILCAEALYFRCHRRHISDELVRRGWSVIHIVSETRSLTHAELPIQEVLPV